MKVNALSLSLVSLFFSVILSIFDKRLILSIFFTFLPAIYFYFKRVEYSLSISIIYDSIKIFLIVGILSVVVAIFLNFFSYYDLDKIKEHVDSASPLILVSAILLSPIMEELFFRAMLIETLNFIKNKTIVILIATFLFTLFHVSYGSVTELVGVFLIAAVFSSYYIHKRELFPLIIAHSFFNFVSIIMYLLT